MDSLISVAVLSSVSLIWLSSVAGVVEYFVVVECFVCFRAVVMSVLAEH